LENKLFDIFDALCTSEIYMVSLLLNCVTVTTNTLLISVASYRNKCPLKNLAES